MKSPKKKFFGLFLFHAFVPKRSQSFPHPPLFPLFLATYSELSGNLTQFTLNISETIENFSRDYREQRL